MTCSAYTVTRREGLTIINGNVPLGDMISLLDGVENKNQNLDTHIASALGATLVWGSSVACEKERLRLGLSVTPPSDIAGADTDSQVDAWLQRGHVGASSKTIARYLTKRPLIEPPALPSDADDFSRCIELLNWAPQLRECLKNLKTISPSWTALVDKWPDFEALLCQGQSGRIRLHVELRSIRGVMDE